MPQPRKYSINCSLVGYFMDFREVIRDAYADVIWFKAEHGRAFACICSFALGWLVAKIF